jgi:hypothetical protein
VTHVPVQRAARLVWLATALVSLAGLAVELVGHLVAGAHESRAVETFSLSYEGNVPTWYSSVLLVGAALATALFALHLRQSGGRFTRRWMLLACLLAYVSLDETATLHERLNGLFSVEGLDGWLTFGWILPVGAAVVLLAIAYFPIVFALPRATRNLVILAGVLYVGGALVFELPLGWWTAQAGEESLGYILIDWGEETLELAGATLYLATMAGHLVAVSPELRLGGKR